MNTDLRRPHCLACKARLSEKPLLTLEGFVPEIHFSKGFQDLIDGR